MRKFTIFSLLTFMVMSFILVANNPEFSNASSHREAPLISNDPLADNTDLYVFRAPDDPNAVIIAANYIPLTRA